MINLTFRRHFSGVCKRNYCRENEKAYPRQVFSAIQPTGEVHLGNYLGAIKKWVELQEKENCIFNIADLHSITAHQDPTTLRKNILLMTATLLACGLDEKKCIFYRQSDVPQHTELSWILGTFCTLHRLLRIPQLKEKCDPKKSVPLGLLLYPILQAADIALYKATHIPVGEDQSSHVNLSNELINSFNAFCGVTFPHVNILLDEKASSIKSLTEPNKKMSKSGSPKSCIFLSDPPDEISKKCKKALTDCEGRLSYDPENRPGISNLISIHSCLTNQSTESICESSNHLNTGQYKLLVADIIAETLRPIRENINRLMASEDYLTNILQSGAERAQERAEVTMKEVKHKIGFK